jgi:hypothetical protein
MACQKTPFMMESPGFKFGAMASPNPSALFAIHPCEPVELKKRTEHENSVTQPQYDGFL